MKALSGVFLSFLLLPASPVVRTGLTGVASTVATGPLKLFPRSLFRLLGVFGSAAISLIFPGLL